MPKRNAARAVDHPACPSQSRRKRVEVIQSTLQEEIDRQDPSLPLIERMKPIWDRMDALRADAKKRGLVGRDDFDMKAFTDEGWGGI